jgi:DNA phosphorothioation-associated putative methyltransferase
MRQSSGKQVAARLYLHVDALPGADAGLSARISAAEALAGLARGEGYNLARLDLDGPAVALLHYPDLFDDPFPALAASWLVDPAAGTVSHRTYADSLNPPILHRKELLLPADHPRRAEFAAITEACEAIGLFDEPTRIGYRRQWLDLVREKGYRIEGHALLPLGNAEADGDAGEAPEDPALFGHWQAARQLTALVRYGFSAPVQSLARYGFLDGRHRLFDYGCGRGDDLRGLAENGLEAAGWDPFYAPDGALTSADIVNLGFVINVIEDPEERLTALTRAWSLAERLLVVSVMLANQNDAQGQRFRDGVLTRRGTFQKYFTQAEIRAYLVAALDEEAIPVAPGVLYVFRDKDAEQRFLVDRYRSRRSPLRVVDRPRRERLPRPPREARAQGRSAVERAQARYDACRGPLDRLWSLWLDLGRPPEADEVPPEDLAALTETCGTLARALRLMDGRSEPESLSRARAARVADLSVYLALMQFERRKPYRHLEPGLQRDIKALFGDYAAAQAAGLDLLFQVVDTQAIGAACREAAQRGLGWLDLGDAADHGPGRAEGGVPMGETRSLQLHSTLVERLPPLLRVYVGCAAVLYGDYRNADLVKIHIGSGKLSLMRYDDFAGSPLPRMVERVKIKLREQDIDYFAYGEEYEPPFLFRKSRFINEEFPRYPEQVAFEEALEGLGLFDLSGYGPPPRAFAETLARHRWEIDGFELRRARTIPDLDAPCGRFLTFRHLIECGETQARTGMPNLPREPDSWSALLDLAVQVLDPVIDWFGMIQLTYGFCSPRLAREIPGRIDPRLDQHAACEHNRLGRPVCKRLGAAADLLVEDEDMLEVARWVAMHTPFDRLYFYGRDLPIHVSFGPQHSRQVVRMLPGKGGRLVPRVVALEDFAAGV